LFMISVIKAVQYSNLFEVFILTFQWIFFNGKDCKCYIDRARKGFL
jgi:hypothetical protein